VWGGGSGARRCGSSAGVGQQLWCTGVIASRLKLHASSVSACGFKYQQNLSVIVKTENLVQSSFFGTPKTGRLHLKMNFKKIQKLIFVIKTNQISVKPMEISF
jgi:hypothetical protein